MLLLLWMLVNENKSSSASWTLGAQAWQSSDMIVNTLEGVCLQILHTLVPLCYVSIHFSGVWPEKVGH